MSNNSVVERAQKTWIVKALILLLAISGILANAVPAQAVTGNAYASRPSYNYETGQMQYSCSFSSWTYGPTKNWYCKLTIGTAQGTEVARRSGTNSSPSWSTPTLSYTKTNTKYCVTAYAKESGSSAATMTQCN